jgi:nitric oxide reductase NorD protein
VEPEELVAHAALRATVAARALWRRHTPSVGPLQLASVKLRLELFVTALHGSCPIIVPADPPPAVNGLRALAQFRLRRPASRVALAATDGVHLFLPRSIEPSRGDSGDLALLRLLALEMAARVARGSVAFLPQDALTRDLYALAEASAIDRALARDLPGLAAELATERTRCLVNRPALGRVSACEHEVEELARCVLAGECPESELAANTPEANLTWARARAAACADSHNYRGLAAVLLWGRMAPPLPAAAARASSEPSSRQRPQRSQALPRTPRART